MKSSQNSHIKKLADCLKLRDQGELRKALKCVLKLIGSVKNDSLLLVNALLLQAVICRDLSKPGDALKILAKALKIASDKSMIREKTDIYRQKSYLLIELGRSSEAEILAFEALDMARKHFLKMEEANIDACIGHVFEDRRDFQRAISWYQEGIAICEEINFGERKATLLGDIGKVYGIMGGHLSESFSFLKQALDLSVGIKYEKAIISSLYRLGDSYRSIGDGAKAMDFYNQAAEKSKNMGFKREEGDSLYRLGLLAISGQKPDEALDFLTRALNIFEDMQYLRQSIHCLLAIGHALEQKSGVLEALEKYLEAFRILPSIFDYTDAYIQIVDDIISTYRKLNHLKEADELDDLLNDLRESSEKSGVFDDFRRKEKIAAATSRIMDVIGRMQNIRENVYLVDGLFIDFNKKTITKDDRPVKLTKDQWKILECLWINKQQASPRQELRAAIGWGSDIATRTVDEQIYKMRKKIGQKYILANRGRGYNLLMPD